MIDGRTLELKEQAARKKRTNIKVRLTSTTPLFEDFVVEEKTKLLSEVLSTRRLLRV